MAKFAISVAAPLPLTVPPVEPEPEPETAQPEVQPQPAPEPEPTADTEAPQPVEDDPEASFQMAFPMLNYATFQRYLAERPETLADGWEHIRINEAALTTRARASRPNRVTRCWPSTLNTVSCSCV